jgi:hypothetical protein
MKKLIVLAVLCCSQAAFALQAPFLYTADSASDTSVQLTWRNNSTAYLGVIVLRKTALAAPYTVADTAPGTATSLTDIVKPMAATTYYYALTAYSQTEHADTSSGDSVRITPPKSVPFDSILRPPLQLFITWDTATHACHVTFNDSSNVETGHRVYRSTNFGSFQMVKDIPSVIPAQEGYLTDTDATVSPNTWNLYAVETYKGQQVLRSDTDTIFTFDINSMKKTFPRKCSVLNKIGSFPIKYGTWALKSGDTIVLNESYAPDSVFSIIDVSNPNAPRFAGTGKSGASALFFHENTTGFAYTKGAYIFQANGDSLRCYRYNLGTIQPLSSINIGRAVFPPSGFLSDSVLIVSSWAIDSCNGCASPLKHLWVGEVLFKNNILSYLKEETLYQQRCQSFTAACGFSSSLTNGVVYQQRLFTAINGQNGSSFLNYPVVVDFNYSVPVKIGLDPYLTFEAGYQSDPIMQMSLLSSGISLDGLDPDTSNAILVDTIKNLVFVLSNFYIDVYNCQIATEVSYPTSSMPHREQFLHVGLAKENLRSFIFLPRHTEPATIAIYDVTGRRIFHVEGIQGQAVLWPGQSRSGVYVLRAVLDGKSVSARVVLTK